MLKTLRNAWGIPELKKKIIFTLFILLLYRVGSVIPVPYIDTASLKTYYDSVLSTTILGLYNAMSGSAFSQATVFALGIQPYINASIIIQLLTVFCFPPWRDWPRKAARKVSRRSPGSPGLPPLAWAC